MNRPLDGLGLTGWRGVVLSSAAAVLLGAAWTSRVAADELSSALFGQVASAVAAFPAATQDDDKETSKATPDERFQKLAQQYQKETGAWYKKRQEADPQERNALMPEYYGIIKKYVGSFSDFAQDHRNTPTAAKALLWIIRNGASSGGNAEVVKQAVEQFVADHEGDPLFAQVLASLPNIRGINAEAIYRRLLQQSDSHDVQGLACYFLAKQVIGRALRMGTMTDEQEKTAVAMFERAQNEFGDVKMRGRTLAEIVEPDLFELLHLRIGKVAPEIEGEDIDGAELKLTDYRGKVVVLDFWGHW